MFKRGDLPLAAPPSVGNLRWHPRRPTGGWSEFAIDGIWSCGAWMSNAVTEEFQGVARRDSHGRVTRHVATLDLAASMVATH